MLGAEAKRRIAAVIVGLVVGLGGVAGQPAAQARRDDNGPAPDPRGDYDRQISNMVCHTVAGPGAADRPPCTDRCGARPCGGCTPPPSGGDREGSGRGCPDCYERPPSNAGGGNGRGCPDCYERPPS